MASSLREPSGACRRHSTRQVCGSPRRWLSAPDRPELVASLFHLEQDHRFGIDAVDCRGSVLRQPSLQSLTVHQQAFGATKLDRPLTVLEALPAGGRVGPWPHPGRVGCPEKIAIAAIGRLDRLRPERYDDRSVGLSNAAPARAHVLQRYATSLERLRASNKLPRRCARSRVAARFPLRARAPFHLQYLAA